MTGVPHKFATAPAGNVPASQIDDDFAATMILADKGQVFSGGAIITSNNLGTVSGGTVTINCGNGPLQYLTNNGAFTMAAPAADGSCMVLTTNGAAAGTITFTGFSVGVFTGDALTTTNTSNFTITIWRINGKSSYRVAALQ